MVILFFTFCWISALTRPWHCESAAVCLSLRRTVHKFENFTSLYQFRVFFCEMTGSENKNHSGALILFSLCPQLSSSRPTRWTLWSIWKPWRPWRTDWKPESTSAKPTSWWSPVLTCPPNIDRQMDGQRRRGWTRQKPTFNSGLI